MEDLAKLFAKLDANKIAMFLGAFLLITASGWYTTVDEPDIVFILTMVGVASTIFLVGALLAVIKVKEEQRTKRLEERMEYQERKRKELLDAGADPNKLSDQTIIQEK